MKHWQASVFFLISWSMIVGAESPEARPRIIQTVERILKADYEGDRAAHRQLYEQLSPYVEDKDIGSRVRYWRGFALWRRAINAFFEESLDPKEVEQDLMQAIEEFRKATTQDPGFKDAKIGAASCVGYLGYLHRNNSERVKELVPQASELFKELQTILPDHPRLIWVKGPWVWNTPVEQGGGQANAIESYKRGLELIQKNHGKNDPLEPSWGEPELLMSLAWSYLNRKEPDLNAAEENARAALAIIPYWHYVRDILLPQILDAKTKAKSAIDIPGPQK